MEVLLQAPVNIGTNSPASFRFANEAIRLLIGATTWREESMVDDRFVQYTVNMIEHIKYVKSDTKFTLSYLALVCLL